MMLKVLYCNVFFELFYFQGSYHLYVYHNTSQKVKGTLPEVNWDFAQKELAEADGIDQFDKAMDNKGESCITPLYANSLIFCLTKMSFVDDITKFPIRFGRLLGNSTEIEFYSYPTSLN